MNLQPTEITEKTPTRLKWRRLETIAEVRLALAVVVKKVFDEKLTPERGAVCINGLRALGKTLHDSNLEARVEELERKTSQ